MDAPRVPPAWDLHAYLPTVGLNLVVEMKLFRMGNFLVEHAERMIDFGNSLEIGLPFLIRWVPSGNHGTWAFGLEQGRSRVT